MSTIHKRSTALALILGLLAAMATATPTLAAAPNNDLMSRPVLIPANPYHYAPHHTNIEAGFGGEPTPTCQPSVGSSIWFRYRPEAPMKAELYTVNGGAPILYDSVIAVYRPTATGFQQVACDDDSGDGNHARVQWTAAGDTSYWVQVTGYQGQQGNFFLVAHMVLANDLFGGARSISPGFSDSFGTTNAYTQSNEPAASPLNCPNPTKTVWFKYKPSANRNVVFDTLGSNFDTIVVVYRGTSISTLARINCSDDLFPGANGPSVVSWLAQANRTYMIQVGGYSDAEGQLEVNFSKQP